MQAAQRSGTHVIIITIVITVLLFLTTGNSDSSLPMCRAFCRDLQMLHLKDEETKAQWGSTGLPRLAELVSKKTEHTHKKKKTKKRCLSLLSQIEVQIEMTIM